MNDEAPPTTSDGISDRQLQVITVLKICSATLSMVGSSTIVLKIIRDLVLTRSTTPYDRIILGLSICDVFASIVYAINPFLVPSETGDVWAFGTPATCRIGGFLNQLFSFWAVWYNCVLSYYFLLTVISQVQLNNFVKKYEPWMHLSGIYFLITAIIGYRYDWYAKQETLGWCWITDPTVKWIFGGIPTMFVFLSVTINNFVIYAVLQKSLQSSEHVAGPTLEQERIKREATTLMFLYVAAFLVTISPNFVLQILETYFGYTYDNSGKIMYLLLILVVMTLPLQGFFNVFIYLKPIYTRFRAANPNKPMYFVLHQALFNPEVPQLISPTDQSVTDAIREGATTNPNQALFNPNFRPHSSSSNSSSSSDSSSSTK